MNAERTDSPPSDGEQILLYGTNREERIVAVTAGDDSHMRLYRRTAGGVVSSLVPFFPFLFVTDDSLLAGIRSKHWLKQLEGANPFRYLCVFSRWTDMWSAVQGIVAAYNAKVQRPVHAYAEVPALFLRPDPVVQFLLQSGTTCFKGMSFGDIHRLQIDIETYSSGPRHFSNPSRLSDRIVLIALSDSRGWREVLDGRNLSEPEMLRRFCGLVAEKDPDVLEGHNILQFDLPYLLTRCALHGIEPAIGREGASVRVPEATGASRFEQLTVEIPGRNIVDTYLLVEAYDARHGTLESYGLKAVARQFGLARPDRVMIPGARISWYWEHEPDTLVRYALDDLEETRKLSELLLPAYVEMAQILPFSLGGCIRAGAAAKPESLLLREYLRRRCALPRAPVVPAQAPASGIAELFYTGVFHGVCHAQFSPLYAALMLGQRIRPASDEQDVFIPLLEALQALRARHDDTPRDASVPGHETGADILLHGFGGYLGSPKALFGDAAAASRLGRAAQKVIQDLTGSIAARKGVPVHADTRGIYFVPPATIRTPADEARFIQSLNEGLPAGCSLAPGGRFTSMLAYRRNNFALLAAGDRVVLHGTSLDVRSQERFLRAFSLRVIGALLRGTPEALHTLVNAVRRELAAHKLTVADFARAETLRSDLDTYLAEVEEGKRNRSASYEAAIAANVRWKPGDRVSYYVAGTDPRAREFAQSKLVEEWNPAAPDENTGFYLRRLDEQLRKFQVFFSAEDFEKIAGSEESFDFAGAPVSVVTRAVAAVPEGRTVPEAPEEEEPFEPSIWLDEDES